MVVAPRENTALSQRSSYLDHLPPIYSESDFMGRFLMIFESIMGPIEGVIDNIAQYFDPGTAPQELLPWLASWLNLTLDETWPLERRRELIKSSVELFRWRGTKRGLREYVRVYTGVEPEITEDFGSLSLDGSSRLGINAVLGSGGGQYTFKVRLELADPDSVNVPQLKAIIESEKPAFAGYTLELIRRDPEGIPSAEPSPEKPPEIPSETAEDT